MNNERKETLVNKLQGALQHLRRERDQVHRSKELSLERARLAKEEEQNLLKVFNDMKQRLDQLTKSSQKINEELGPMERQLEFKTKEMNFQHAELLSAREKIQQMNRAMEQSAREREESLQRARQLLCERRNKLQSTELKALKGDLMPVERQKELLEREVNCGFFDWDTFLKTMENQAKNLTLRAQTLHDEMGRDLGPEEMAE